MPTMFGPRTGLPYRTLALCLTTFVIVANISFWMFTSSQPDNEHHKIALKSVGSNHNRRSPSELNPRFEYVKVTEPETTRSVVALNQLNPLSKGQLESSGQSTSQQHSTNGKGLEKDAPTGQNVLIYPELLVVPPREVSELDGRVIPNTVHYIWCGNATFEYRHFLSVMSVWTVMEPDAIEFRYETPPREDKYNTWFTFLRTHLPMFQASPLAEWVTGNQCGDAHGLETVADMGGVYVGTDVVLGPGAGAHLVYNNFTVAFKSDMSIGIAAGTSKNKNIRFLIETFTQHQSTLNTLSSIGQSGKRSGFQSGNQILEQLVLKETSIRNYFQTNTNQSSRMFHCSDTGKIQNLEKVFSSSAFPYEMHDSGKAKGDVCLSVDSRLQPRHVIEGHVDNPLVSLLYRYAYNGRKRQASKPSLASKDPSYEQPILEQTDPAKSSKLSHVNGSRDDTVLDKNTPHVQINTTQSQKTLMDKTFSKTDNGTTGMAVPRLIHYVWFGQKEMSFGMYLSFLSSVYVVKPDRILIHGDGNLSGKFWDLVRKHPLVKLVYRDPPYSIFSKAVVYTSHRSDIVRADILDKYGGAYVDWDAYWLSSPDKYLQPESTSNHSNSQETLRIDERSLSPENVHLNSSLQTAANASANSESLKVQPLVQDEKASQFQTHFTEADAVVSRDHIPRPPFPDTINMGVVLARPRSKFIRAWRAALVDYRSREFLYNAVELPYKIFEMFPQSVVVDDRLQVMCYHLLCHPTYQPGYKLWYKAQPFNWTQDGVHAIHFTHPDPPAFHNLTSLLQAPGMFADIGRYIWGLQPKPDRAGLL